MQVYGKSIIAALYAVAVVAVPLFSGDKHIDPSEGVAIVIAVCTAALTYLVPLAPSATWVKTAIGAVLAGAQVTTTVIIGGVDSNDVLLPLLSRKERLELADEWGTPNVYFSKTSANLGFDKPQQIALPGGDGLRHTAKAWRNEDGQPIGGRKYQFVSAGRDQLFNTDDDLTWPQRER